MGQPTIKTSRSAAHVQDFFSRPQLGLARKGNCSWESIVERIERFQCLGITIEMCMPYFGWQRIVVPKVPLEQLLADAGKTSDVEERM